MSFSVESEFLDLKKVYQNFEYESLTQDQKIVAQSVEGPDQKQIYEGMTQNTYLFVTEKGVLIKDIENIAEYFVHKWVKPNPLVRQKAFECFPFQKVKDRVCYIFQKYQEQPALLDSLLEPLITPIMSATKQYLSKMLAVTTPPCEQFHSMIQIIYQLTKVRGKKYTTKYFPHEVRDLEPAVAYLVRWRQELAHWETKYIILLWLSVIILVPFDLETIDSKHMELTSDKGESVSGMINTLMETAKYYLRSSTKMRESAAYFLSKLFTRPDIQKMELLSVYLKYVLEQLSTLEENQINSFFICGLYCSLKDIFKAVARSELLPKINPILEQIRKESKNQKENPVKKFLKTKLLTRIGLVYLKPRVAKWAYRKSKKSLKQNLSKVGIVGKLKTNATPAALEKHQDRYGDVDDSEIEYYKDVDKVCLEEVIDLLIESLAQKQTSVREAASKGLGMISGRLSPDMIEDILEHILDLFPSPQTHHSICLTLAELIRRNLLSPQRLKGLYPLIQESLLYEKQEGGYSIGQAVRDAACYMTWAVARGYEDGGELGVSLMIAACFDREVGCRRAASAAYQELVGRVGGVPNGIEVLTEADYFTLGLQKNSYLNVGIFVASYQAYFKPFVENLGYQKLRHWDLQMKRIAACSLSLMCPLNPHFMAKELLPALIRYLNADAMNTKLGSIIGIGEVLIGLAGKSHIHQLHNEMKDSVFLKSLTQNQKKLMHAGEYMTKFRDLYDKARTENNLLLIQREEVANIIKALRNFISMNIFKGKAGQNFRVATCRLLQCLALSGIELDPDDVAIFTNFLQDNIKNPVEFIINAAVKSLKPFSEQYHTVEHQSKLVDHMLHNAMTLLPFAQGYTLAVSSLSSKLKIAFFSKILTSLESNCKILKDKEDDAIRRKNSVIAIESLVEAIGFANECFTAQTIERIFKILISTMNDYSTDKRGDIGSLVRQASMKALIRMVELYTQTKDRFAVIKDQLVFEMIANMIQQLTEKIDRIRLLAGSLLQSYFDNLSQHFKIPRQKQLERHFQQQNIKKLIKQGQQKVDKTLEPEVMQMQMKIQQTVFQQVDHYLIFYWNLPHCVFPLVVPLLEYKQYSYHLLKGLCTSTGGISESVIKYSLQELGSYIGRLTKENRDDLIEQLLVESIIILEKHYRDERVVVPMYKTLDFILERQEIASWPGLPKLSDRLYAALSRQCNKSKMIIKIGAAVGIYVHLLKLKNLMIQKKILSSIVNFLCSDLPKVRKILADKLLLLVMSQENYETFTIEQSDELTLILSENDFVDEKLDVNQLKEDLNRIFELSP